MGTFIDEVNYLRSRTLTARLFASYTEGLSLVALGIKISSETLVSMDSDNALYLDMAADTEATAYQDCQAYSKI